MRRVRCVWSRSTRGDARRRPVDDRLGGQGRRRLRTTPTDGEELRLIREELDPDGVYTK
jgi:hypothetical protein